MSDIFGKIREATAHILPEDMQKAFKKKYLKSVHRVTYPVHHTVDTSKDVPTLTYSPRPLPPPSVPPPMPPPVSLQDIMPPTSFPSSSSSPSSSTTFKNKSHHVENSIRRRASKAFKACPSIPSVDHCLGMVRNRIKLPISWYQSSFRVVFVSNPNMKGDLQWEDRSGVHALGRICGRRYYHIATNNMQEIEREFSSRSIIIICNPNMVIDWKKLKIIDSIIIVGSSTSLSMSEISSGKNTFFFSLQSNATFCMSQKLILRIECLWNIFPNFIKTD